MRDDDEDIARLSRIELQVTNQILQQFPTEQYHLEFIKRERRKRERIQRDGHTRRSLLGRLLFRPNE